MLYEVITGSAGKLKAVTLANTFTTLFYAYAVFTSLIVFSPQELDLLPQPLLYVITSYSIHYTKLYEIERHPLSSSPHLLLS